ncbi:MAG: ABC transporter permease [Pseudomonadota bacterium]
MNGISAPRLAARALGREWRHGELRIIILALIIAAAGMGAVGLFSDRVDRALGQQASETLAADLAVEGDAALPGAWRTEAEQRDLRHARLTTLPTMAATGDDGPPQMVRLKAVGDGYPLRGEVVVAATIDGEGRATAARPSPGTVRVERGLMRRLDLAPGDTLSLGRKTFTIDQVLVREPDQSSGMAGLAPRVQIRVEDLPATELVQPGSRVSHRLLFAGDPGGLDAFADWLAPRLEPGQDLLTPREAQPALDEALSQAQRYLALVALLTAAVGGVAVALVARRYAERHRDTAALLRAFGAPGRLVGRAFLWQLVLLGIIASLAGVGVAFAAQEVLARIAAGLFELTLPPPAPGPALAAGLLAAGLLLAFGLPPLLRLGRVPPARVLRRDLTPPPVSVWLLWGVPAAALLLVIGWTAGAPVLAIGVFGGLAAIIAVLAGAAGLLLMAIQRLGRHRGRAWRYGLANLGRRPGTTVVQVVGLGVGLAALLILTLVRTDLLESWRASIPDEAPDHFVINIQPDDVDAVRETLTAAGVASPNLYPMVRGRLVAVNGEAVEPDDYAEGRARRLVDRAFNLTWAEEPPPNNEVVAGRWWGPESTEDALSLERGIADTLDLDLGDTLHFRIAGREREVTVTSLREVDWTSFQPNFFAITPPAVLADAPATWITSFRLPADAPGLPGELNRAHPGLTLIDTGHIIERVRGIMDRVAAAVEYLFGFTLLAGLLLLYAALEATLDERRRDGAILRALGAPRALLIRATLAEFATLGATAGLVAGLAASAFGMVLARMAFELAWQPSPLIPLAGLVAGAVVAAATGLAGGRRIIREPPLAVLRRTGL